jgi:hypothetical protein
MLTLDGFPKNKDKFVRLIEYFKEILDICNDLRIAPVLDGSLAVFAYTGYQEMNVNDVDLSCPEADFPGIIKALEEKGMNYKLREWHVLQVSKDDLEVELGSTEYWLKNLPIDYETLQVDDYKIKMLGLNSLKEFYKRGMEDKTDENERMKYEALKEKYELLNSVTQTNY